MEFEEHEKHEMQKGDKNDKIDRCDQKRVSTRIFGTAQKKPHTSEKNENYSTRDACVAVFLCSTE